MTATLQVAPAARLQLAVFMENTPCPPVWVAVTFIASPEAHSSMADLSVVPGRTDTFTP